MYKSEIAPGLIRYSFDPLPGRHFSSGVYAVVSGGKALLIDAGWEREAAQIAGDLKDAGITPTGVIISHFHDDHMEGLKALYGIQFFGSADYKVTLDLWTDREEHGFYTPTTIIKETTKFSFGEHSIDLIPFPGHSACTMLTMIDGAYLHIADEMMFSPEQEPILPVAEKGCVKRHIDSLERLKSYCSYTLLPAHGQPFYGADEIERQINKRLCYLSEVIIAAGNITYDDATKNSGGFLHGEFHKYNCGE